MPKKSCTSFEEVRGIIESDSHTTSGDVANKLNISKQRVSQILLQNNYCMASLNTERRVIKNETNNAKKEWKREEWLASLAPCGTVPAYKRHLRHKEDPCIPCLDANTDYYREIQEALRNERRPNRRRASEETKRKMRETHRRRSPRRQSADGTTSG